MNQTASSYAPVSGHSSESSTSLSTSVDARLRSMARKALANSGYQAVSALDCQVYDGVVVLRGVVPSYYLKQIAQECVRRLDMADRIDNRVIVVYE